MPGIPWLSRSSAAPKGLPSMRAYRRYRAAGTKLNHKIIEAMLDDSAIHYAVSALGMLGPGKTIILDSEDNSNVLMDFALYEYNTQGKNAIEEYAKEIGGETEIERELLAAMVAASTSLFRV